ncbi:hypothetical protein B296_00054969 [Ensete ventricosum]|uniref:Retrotransposon gag domain-containing protein n=1 Tax=Ensete ventricosum TaxID=4639 RepID=A0A426WW63_ENSVE|nr:hypothetical protein B296_00054969 [Ensete ventricosum]
MDSHDNTSEEATSAQGTKSATDLESEVEVTGYDTAYPMPINVAWRITPSPHATAAARPPYVSVVSRGTTKDRHPRDGPRGKTDQAPRRGPLRERQSTQEASIPTDVGRLAHSNENKSSRHLSSTPESFVTFLALEGGPMSQERPTSNPNTEHPGGSIHVLRSTLQPVGQAPRIPTVEASTMLATPNRYWRLFNDPRFAPPDLGLSPITSGLGPLQEAPQSRSSQGEHPGGAPHPPVEAMIENPNALVSQPSNRSRDVMRLPLEPDFVSSDSTNLVREQLRQVNQRLDEVQKGFVRSKKEVEETTKGGSPFAPEILDKPIPSSFRLPTLEPYDGSTNPTEHVAAFKALMALYNTSDALMCRTFPTTLYGPAQMWYSRIKSSSISSFDQFAKEFKLNFIASSCLRPTTASLLGLTQGNDEPLAQFISRFSMEIRRMPDTYPTLAIQVFLMGLRPSRFFWSLIKRPPSTVPEMLQRASQYVAAESLVAEKREDHKKPRGFTGDSISPVGTVVLPVTVGEELRSKTLLVSFIVVALPSTYNAIISRPMLNKLRAIVSTYHRIMKFPTRAGVGEV